MIFKCGIIGLPNVGKSTLFNTLTSSSAKTENFPFCTIAANKAHVPILDVRLYQLANLICTDHVVHGNIEVIDIAGLIKGASQGSGLGNKFLIDISKADILCHVVRCFKNHDILHVSNDINPKRDALIIHDELILSDIELCEHELSLFKKNNVLYKKDRNVEIILSLLRRCLIHLNSRRLLNSMTLNEKELIIVKKFNFLTLKPIIYIANTDGNINNNYVAQIVELSLNTNIPYIEICIVSEKPFFSLKNYNDFSCNTTFLKLYPKKSKILNVVKAIYDILKLKTFFTTNMKEVRAWPVSKQTIAIEAANTIHSDFKKGFIRVQVVRYDDFIAYQGFLGAKKFGKVKSEGKNYLIRDGDILNFLI